MLKFDMPDEQAPIIKVIGVGGGGSNAVTHMFKQGIKGVDFYICNTDAQSLYNSEVPNKIKLGSTGLGAGSNPAVGREAAIQIADEIREIISHNTSMLFITAGMGGGTGTGAAPVIAQVAKELGILTVGIITRPFGFEGRKREQQALNGIDELKKYVDSTLVICNDKLLTMQGNIKLSEAFGKADNVLTIAAKGIAEIITVTGRINVDFEDVKTVMKDSGKAIMGAGIASGPNRAIEAVEMAMNSPLLDDTDIKGADNVLLYITSGKEELTLEELNDITGYITEKTGDNANIIWGDGVDSNLSDEITITLIATGFDRPIITKYNLEGANRNTLKAQTPIVKPEAIDEVQIVSPPVQQTIIEQPLQKIDEITFIEKPSIVFQEPIIETREQPTPENYKNVELKSRQEVIPQFEFELNLTPVSTYIQTETAQAVSEEKEIKLPEIDRDRKDKLKNASYKFSNQGGIEELEKTPAYMRKNLDVNSGNIDSNTVSRFSLGADENNQTGLRANNRFLHDNVD